MVAHIEATYIRIDAPTFLGELGRCLDEGSLTQVRARVAALQRHLDRVPLTDPPTGSPGRGDGDGPILRRDVLRAELEQILEAQTTARAHYYLTRLQRGVTDVRTTAVNDINLNRWKEYDEILTDSLWMMDRRDRHGSHGAWYWGNFIPQIPHQLMLRYTKAGDWVLDPFSGSGTTLIECRRLGRNGLGVELNPDTAARSADVVGAEPNPYDVTTQVIVGDSAVLDLDARLEQHGLDRVQMAILHPPYHDIIRFSDAPDDLSNASSVDAFVERFSSVIAHVRGVLEPGRFLAIVIGDKYEAGSWVPLGFYVMQAAMAQGLALKSIVVKNLNGTQAKRDQQALWRYRALVAGFYVFKHEYIFLLQN